jgi:folate-binding protein YgfZ
MEKDVSEIMNERKPYFVTLPGRGLIRIAGADRRAFLDALISHDLNLLDHKKSFYACLLTPQGKFLYDFVIFEKNDSLILDCEGGARLTDLAKKLTLYKLRSKITIEPIDSKPIFATTDEAEYAYPDPRHPDMGFRTLKKPASMAEEPFTLWDARRIALCIPDGSRDLVVGQSTLIEAGIDRLNGVSFDKGCYIGQELTARMHHRGLAKKHLYALCWPDGTTPPATGDDIMLDGAVVGQMRSQCGQTGLALLKDEAVPALRQNRQGPAFYADRGQ